MPDVLSGADLRRIRDDIARCVKPKDLEVIALLDEIELLRSQCGHLARLLGALSAHVERAQRELGAGLREAAS